MEKIYIWVALGLADGGKIVLLICQEGKKLPWGFFENDPVRLAGIPLIQLQARENDVREGNILIWKKSCLFNTSYLTVNHTEDEINHCFYCQNAMGYFKSKGDHARI